MVAGGGLQHTPAAGWNALLTLHLPSAVLSLVPAL